jgi:hypothetical protein
MLFRAAEKDGVSVKCRVISVLLFFFSSQNNFNLRTCGGERKWGTHTHTKKKQTRMNLRRERNWNERQFDCSGARRRSSDGVCCLSSIQNVKEEEK